MQKQHSVGSIIGLSAVMLVLILDIRTAIESASQAISLCITTVIPSLFPMMVLSSLLTDRIAASTTHSTGKLCSALGIPSGQEGLIVSGFLGGYPVGAACIGTQYRMGNLERRDAEHLLYFCSNVGPSFLFGICGQLFSSKPAVWVLWAVHITSALMVGITHINKTTERYKQHKNTVRSTPEIIRSAMANMGVICGWVVMFRVIIQFCQKWLFCYLPTEIGIIISGILELTNGSCMLNQIKNELLRFVICSVTLAFGGICVILQTASVISPLSTASYLRGKITQSLYSLFLSASTGYVIYTNLTGLIKTVLITLILITPPTLLYLYKKMVAFSEKCAIM